MRYETQSKVLYSSQAGSIGKVGPVVVFVNSLELTKSILTAINGLLLMQSQVNAKYSDFFIY